MKVQIMRPMVFLRTLCFASFAIALPLPSALALHLDVQVQRVSEKLTTGSADFDSGSFILGTRVYSQAFNSLYAVNNPGFNAIGTTTGTLPAGSDALPGNTELSWDFLPMKVDGDASNLLYWDGMGSTLAEVTFGPTPTSDYSLSLFGQNNEQAAADGSDQLIVGKVIDTTASDGFMHIHRYFFLDDDMNPNNSTIADSGVYLLSMRLRMAGLDRSDPMFIVWATPGVSESTLGVASMWVADHIDELAPNFSADFDSDLDVDGADFLTWQRGFGVTADPRQVDGDADGDHTVSASDLGLWQAQYGSSLSSFPGSTSGLTIVAAAPEPSTMLLCLFAVAIIVLRNVRSCCVCQQARFYTNTD